MRGRGLGKSRYPKMGGQYAHRTVIERDMGAKIPKGKVVHHRDGNTRNFSRENLVLLPSQSAHMILEWQIRKRKKK